MVFAADKICTNKHNEYPRCLFYILRCLGQLQRDEIIAYNGPCIHASKWGLLLLTFKKYETW